MGRHRSISPAGAQALDAEQTGYGAAYRIYRCADDAWIALAVADASAWARLRGALELSVLPSAPPALRLRGDEAQPAERTLEEAFRTKPAEVWLELLRRAQVPVERVAELDRASFSDGFLDDPINHQLGRVTHYTLGERGRVDQPTFPPRLGPTARAECASLRGRARRTHRRGARTARRRRRGALTELRPLVRVLDSRYDAGMTAAKIAITLPQEQLAQVRKAVRAGRADSVSGYIARVLAEHAHEESLRELVRDLIAQHGQPTREEAAWAKRALARRRRA